MILWPRCRATAIRLGTGVTELTRAVLFGEPGFEYFWKDEGAAGTIGSALIWQLRPDGPAAARFDQLA